eukprot:s662_g30.t1
MARATDATGLGLSGHIVSSRNPLLGGEPPASIEASLLNGGPRHHPQRRSGKPNTHLDSRTAATVMKYRHCCKLPHQLGQKILFGRPGLATPCHPRQHRHPCHQPHAGWHNGTEKEGQVEPVGEDPGDPAL